MDGTAKARLLVCIGLAAATVAASCAIATAARATGADDDPRYPAFRGATPHHQAEPARRAVVRHAARARVDSNGNCVGCVTVPTAAGIDITVFAEHAGKFQGFIADLVASGYTPGRIRCFNLARSHVPNSWHFVGGACDFNQRGWNKTDRPMYRVRALAAKWGLRDGCSFRDCGHIDIGPRFVRGNGRHRHLARTE